MFRNRLRSLVGLIFAATLACSASSYAAPDKPIAPDSTASSAKVASDSTPADFNIKNPYEWVQLGKNAGLAMAEIAGQLGVAGDKVLDSNSGKIAVALVGAKLLGVTAGDLAEIPYRILSFFLGIAFLVVGVRIWSRFLNFGSGTQADIPSSDRSDNEKKRARVERAVVGSAIIPIVMFGTGLIFYTGAGFVFGAIAAIVLAIVQFVVVIDPK